MLWLTLCLPHFSEYTKNRQDRRGTTYFVITNKQQKITKGRNVECVIPLLWISQLAYWVQEEWSLNLSVLFFLCVSFFFLPSFAAYLSPGTALGKYTRTFTWTNLRGFDRMHCAFIFMYYLAFFSSRLSSLSVSFFFALRLPHCFRHGRSRGHERWKISKAGNFVGMGSVLAFKY